MNFDSSEKFSRNLIYPGPILFIDGLTGTGKTIFINLINSTRSSHAVSFNYGLEQICIANHFDKISSDATAALVRLKLDQTRFDFNISREVNFRLKDLSSIWRSKEKFKYLIKLMNDGNNDSQLYGNPKFVTYIVHQLLHTTQVMNDIYKKDFYKIFCTRHPAYLYYHWKSYIDNHGTNPRDITLYKTVNKKEIPWFIEANRNIFQEMNAADKAAATIAELTHYSLDHIDANKNNENFLVVDFENFVLKPDSYVEKLQEWFCIDSKHLMKVLLKENIPRRQINRGVKKRIYLRYASGKLSSTDSHKSNYEHLMSSIQNEVTPDVFRQFLDSIDKYEEVFAKWY